MKKILIKVTPLFFSLVVILSAIEFTVRTYILPREVLWYEVNSSAFPFFRLKANLNEGGMTIRNHRREKLERGKRKDSIAFIGDSVTFCIWMQDEDCFVEQIQKMQNRFDVYNYGVPGYGLAEFVASIDTALEKRPKYVVYTVNYNDFFDAMPVTYSLLQEPRRRISTWDEYSKDPKTRLKGFIKDHYKTPFAINYYAGSFDIFDFFVRKPASEPINTPRLVSKNRTQAECVGNMEKQIAENYFFQKTRPFFENLIKDEDKINDIALKFRELRKKAEAKGAKLITLVHQEYSFVSRENHSMRKVLNGIFSDQGIESLDTWPLYERHFNECGFYVESDFHLAVKGNTYLAQYLNESVRNWR